MTSRTDFSLDLAVWLGLLFLFGLLFIIPRVLGRRDIPPPSPEHRPVQNRFGPAGPHENVRVRDLAPLISQALGEWGRRQIERAKARREARSGGASGDGSGT